jgi:hypothetical protein
VIYLWFIVVVVRDTKLLQVFIGVVLECPSWVKALLCHVLRLLLLLAINRAETQNNIVNAVK